MEEIIEFIKRFFVVLMWTAIICIIFVIGVASIIAAVTITPWFFLLAIVMAALLITTIGYIVENA